MDLLGYLGALGRNWLIICLAVVAGLGAGFAAYRLTPATYASTVTFYVASPLPDGVNPQSVGQFAESRVSSYALLLQSDRLASEVAGDSGLPQAEVDGTITASGQPSTVLVTATVSSSSARSAQTIADSVASVFPSMVNDLDNQGSSQTVVKVSVVSGPSKALQVAPSAKKFLALSLVGGLLVGAIIALLKELLDVTVRSVGTVTALVGAPLVGTIDRDASTKKDPLIVGPAATSQRAEAFRQLRTNLLYIDTAEPTDVLLVTSSLPLEGKSTVAADLALAMSESGNRVLLIDGDLRRPSVAAIFGLERAVGLTNILTGRIAAKDAIQSWGDKQLNVLTSGGLPPNPSELLGSPKMGSLMQELRTRYDKIIIDAPPLLPVADAVVASCLTDGVLFVVRHGKTTRTTVATAARALHGIDARVVGTVLNMRRISRWQHRQYAGQGYPVAIDEASLEASAEAKSIDLADGLAGRRSGVSPEAEHMAI